MDNQNYNVGGVQLIDVMEKNFGTEWVYHFCVLNAVKYLFRSEKKHQSPDADLRKAQSYIEHAIKLHNKTNDEQDR